MATIALPTLTACGLELDLSSDTFGWLRSSSEIADDFEALRARMQEDGYLFLPGFLGRERVMAARRSVVEKLAAQGLLDPEAPVMEARAAPGVNPYFMPDLASDNPALMDLLYSGTMMDFYAGLLGGEVRHFDYTWMRAVGHGKGTQPHCDIVYMGRGTTHLFTSWTPLGDVPLEVGGLMVLENSHKNERLKANYGKKDVDAFCTNRHDMRTTGNHGFGALTDNPVRLRERLGGRWLTSEYHMGDLLLFSMFTVHASLDNQTHQIRLSSDTRYQLASEPVDERWVGEKPIGHGEAARRELIC